MISRNARIALMVVFKELSPPEIAAKYNINLSRVYQITQTVKQRYGWHEGMHPNEFSRRIATNDRAGRDWAGCGSIDTPGRMYWEIVSEEMARDRNWSYEG